MLVYALYIHITWASLYKYFKNKHMLHHSFKENNISGICLEL